MPITFKAMTSAAQLAISATTTLVDAVNAYCKDGDQPNRMHRAKHKAIDLVTKAIDSEDPWLMQLLADHYYALAALIKAYDYSYPETCMLKHVEDTVDWLIAGC